jgi:hypothetical protein
VRRSVLAAHAALASLLWPALAWAHAEQGRAEGFLAGLRHPVSGMDHVLAMIAVGLWGAQLGAPAIWLLPVTFPLVMAFGGMLGLAGVALPGVEVGIAVSAIVLGLAVLAEGRPRTTPRRQAVMVRAAARLVQNAASCRCGTSRGLPVLDDEALVSLVAVSPFSERPWPRADLARRSRAAWRDGHRSQRRTLPRGRAAAHTR